jgi:hypothetical protein
MVCVEIPLYYLQAIDISRFDHLHLVLGLDGDLCRPHDSSRG